MPPVEVMNDGQVMEDVLSGADEDEVEPFGKSEAEFGVASAGGGSSTFLRSLPRFTLVLGLGVLARLAERHARAGRVLAVGAQTEGASALGPLPLVALPTFRVNVGHLRHRQGSLRP